MNKSMNWNKINQCNCNCQTFQCGDLPDYIHIVKTNFHNKYILLYDDTDEFNLGLMEINTREYFESKYNIKLD